VGIAGAALLAAGTAAGLPLFAVDFACVQAPTLKASTTAEITQICVIVFIGCSSSHRIRAADFRRLPDDLQMRGHAGEIFSMNR
jgi:hypothetical protein